MGLGTILLDYDSFVAPGKFRFDGRKDLADKDFMVQGPIHINCLCHHCARWTIKTESRCATSRTTDRPNSNLSVEYAVAPSVAPGSSSDTARNITFTVRFLCATCRTGILPTSTSMIDKYRTSCSLVVKKHFRQHARIDKIHRAVL
jgi:hypothetical protein